MKISSDMQEKSYEEIILPNSMSGYTDTEKLEIKRFESVLSCYNSIQGQMSRLLLMLLLKIGCTLTLHVLLAMANMHMQGTQKRLR